jgi:RNA-binding protein
MLTLTVAERQSLKARAHPLNPVVMVGSAGLTPAVLKEISAALKSHELIKIRVMNDDRDEREALLQEICGQLNAAPVQHIGKILVVYQPQPDVPKKPAGRRAKKPLTKKQIGSKVV